MTLTLTACDDDGTGKIFDLSTKQNDDLSVPDLSLSDQPRGQVTLADLVGTAYGASGITARAHALLALADFPAELGTPDATSNLSTVFGLASGCAVARYDYTSTPQKPIPPAADAGQVTLSGYSLKTIGVQSSGVQLRPPAQIKCARTDGDMLYHCGFGDTVDPDGGAVVGTRTGDVLFPLIDLATWTALGLGRCDQPSVGSGVCEQHPIATGGAASISETVSGGPDGYAHENTIIGSAGSAGVDAGAGKAFPEPIFIVSVKSGTAEIAGHDPFDNALGTLDIADGSIDPTADLTVSWSCDGTATPGSGCAARGDAYNLVALIVQSSLNHKDSFASPPSAKLGVAQCAEQLTSPTATATVKAAQLQALLGGQSGGSLQLSLTHLRVDLAAPPAGARRLIVFSAGHGLFGFTNQ